MGSPAPGGLMALSVAAHPRAPELPKQNVDAYTSTAAEGDLQMSKRAKKTIAELTTPK